MKSELARRLPKETMHVCLDMQTMFREGGPWAAPWFERVLPRVQALVERSPASTLFTRFIPPDRPEQAPGAWRRYYERWHQVTRREIDPRQLELAPELARYVPPAHVLDKPAYSPFHGTRLMAMLNRRRIGTLIFSGTETDVCVLSGVLAAVDIGYRVVIARDAVCSSSDSTHDALMRLYHERFSEQIEIAEVDCILDAWER